ncbi:uncharacterized protein [Eurosta solidaginis]|uniref:uncharacterized protein n=1 Tax=Eurosta solidaginis TaxID=178769 RepID=UPI0035311AF1
MGFRYQELKERGDSIELERRESFTTERSHNGYIKRKKTVVRERFQHPDAKELKNNRKKQRPQSEVLTTQRRGTESVRTTTETFGYSPDSSTLISHCRDKSHLERAVNRTSVQLKRLAHEIDNEIAKLKRERDKLMLRPHPHPLMRNAAIQNDLQCDIGSKTAATTNANLKHFNAIADNIEFTVEKFSSQHKFVCTSPRYARDEQTSCRPRMRTIGLQKDTQRNSSVFCDSLQNLKAKLDTALQKSETNLANLKANDVLNPAPPNLYAFDYGGTGDGQNALKIYHSQNCRYAGGCNANANCDCQKICERYNAVGNYNGMLCNKNTYVEKGVTPCSEYNYCRDEYHYDYPRPNLPYRPCTPCLPYQPSQQPCKPCVVPCLPPCPTYSETQPSKPKMQVIYGRRMSDLNTDEFYHPTGGSSPRNTKHGTAKRASTKECITVDVPKDGRTTVDIERHGRAPSKSRRKRADEDSIKQRGSKSHEAGSPDNSNAKRPTRERNTRRKSESSGSADSSERLRHISNKGKLLEITFTKERRRKASTGSGDEGIPHEQPKSVREYTREAKRSMKQMTITAYKPCKPVESEGESEGDRRKRKAWNSRDKAANSKYEDDKTWDERLRRGEQQPRVEQPYTDEVWREGIPTITEFYDNYRVGDTWEAEESNVAQQHYVGAYRDSFQISTRDSYDILPVQKDTVRDLPPLRSPVRGRRLYHNEQKDSNEENIIHSSQTPYGRYTAESNIGQDSPTRAGIRSDSLSHSSGDKARRGAAAVAKHKSYFPREHDAGYKSDQRYMADKASRGDRESITASKTVYAQDEKPRSARAYDYGVGPESKKKPMEESSLRADYEQDSKTLSGTIYASDTKPRSARNFKTVDEKPSSARAYDHSKGSKSAIYASDEKPRSPRHYDDSKGPKSNKINFGESLSFARDEPSGMTKSGGQSIEARPQTANGTPYETAPGNEQLRNADFSPTTKQTSKKTEGKAAVSRFQGDNSNDGYVKDEKTLEKLNEGKSGKPQIKEGYAEKVKVAPSGEYGANVSSADEHKREVEKSKLVPQEMSGLKSEKFEIDSTRAGKDLDYHGPKVPDIHIEDSDESARSGKSGRDESARISLAERAKFAIKGEMVLEPKYSHDANQPENTEDRTTHVGKTGSPSGSYRKPDTISATGKDSGSSHDTNQLANTEDRTKQVGKTGSPSGSYRKPNTISATGKDSGSSARLKNTDTFGDSQTYGRMCETTYKDNHQQLSPFPSLESPRIYMRPRTKCPDYSTVCLPPSVCIKKSSARGNCVENAGDIYMCKPELFNTCQPLSPRPCLTPNRSSNEIPYEKLGDQYTHSPVRQLAASSHLAVALQPDAASGNFIPSPSPKMSKNCIYLRSTGTQYSATIIENHEERCAPQYIPLPKDCSQMSLTEQKDPPTPSRPQSYDAPCENFQTVASTPQNNYKFLCDAECEEYDDKTNLNNDQWCQRVEITNSGKTQICMGLQQAKDNVPLLDCKNYFLPWQHDQKFIPGQPMSDCDVQDVGIKQRARYQSLTDRRMPRFNATMPPHQELPEEEARCAEEIPQYKPQPRVKFMEQSLRHYENSNSCCHPQAEESNFRAAPLEPTLEYGANERPGFNNCREFQQIPQFTGCPCMFKTYLNMITLYYPNCRIPDDVAAEHENGCCNVE